MIQAKEQQERRINSIKAAMARKTMNAVPG